MAAGINVFCIHQQAHGADDLGVVLPQNVVGFNQFFIFLNQKPLQHPVPDSGRGLPCENAQQLALVILGRSFDSNAQRADDLFFIDNRRDDPLTTVRELKTIPHTLYGT